MRKYSAETGCKVNKIFMLSISYIRKAKGQAISFLLINVIAATLLNIGLITLLDYNNLFDEKCLKLNTADAYFLMNEAEYSDDFYDYIQNSNEVTESELVDAILQLGEYQFVEIMQSNAIVFLNADKQNDISRFSFVEKTNKLPDNPIYIPYVLKASANYMLGDDFNLKVAGKTYQYKIAGFIEEMMAGSPTSPNMVFLLHEDDFFQLRNSDNGIYKTKMINVKLSSIKQAPAFISKVNNYMSSQFPNSALRSSVGLEFVKFARTGVASIGSYITIVFSILIVFVSLILAHFRIKNSIDSDMKNIGALKALGYTSYQLIASIILQFIILSASGSIVGIGISYTLLPNVRNMFASNSGMVWELNFNLICFILSVLIISLSSGSIAFLGSKRIKKLPPITALRGGVLTHSFKKNIVPFDKVNSNINILMSAKVFLQGLMQNIMIIIIVTAIFFQMAFSFVFYYNAVVEEDNFINLVTGENGDAIIILDSKNYDENMLSDIQNEPKVRKAFYYDTAIPVTFYEEEMLNGQLNLCENFDINENPKIYEGRNPIHNNEVVLKGSTAIELNKKIGDTLNLTIGNKSFRYLITGLTQDGSGGYVAQMTYDAYRRLVPKYKPTMILFYLNEGESGSAFLDYINQKYKEKISATQNTKEQVYSIIRPMTDTMKLMLNVMVVATLCVIALILQLVIKTNIIRRKVDLGIQKSIGFTTLQLMFQNVISLIPSFIIGSVMGGILSKLFMNKVAGLVMRMAGIMKVDFTIPTIMLVIMGICLALFAFMASMLISIKLRKITAYSLISE